MALELIQIIDDEPHHAALLDLALRKAGYRTNVAHDGLEGLDAMRRLQPALALVDVMLPGADGFEICRRLRADPLTQLLPIIMLTALSSEEQRVAGLTLGVDDYVTKPFSPREVVLRVAAILHRRRPSDHCGESYLDGQVLHERSVHHVSCCGRTVSLSYQEWQALRCWPGGRDRW
jgi:DNA-binding response OmpR family regulator